MSAVVDSLRRTLPAHQVITDDLRRLAYGTDASFYRLIRRSSPSSNRKATSNRC